MSFVDSVFGEDGKIIQEVFPHNKGNHCKWCEFKQRGICSAMELMFYIFVYIYIIKCKKESYARYKINNCKIIKDVYSKFKKLSFDSNITLQKLVNRPLNKYIEEEDLETETNNYQNLQRKWFSVLIMNKQNNGNDTT